MAISKLKTTVIVTKWFPIYKGYRNPWPRKEAYWPLGEKGYEIFKKDVEAFYKSTRYGYCRTVVLAVKSF